MTSSVFTDVPQHTPAVEQQQAMIRGEHRTYYRHCCPADDCVSIWMLDKDEAASVGRDHVAGLGKDHTENGGAS